MFIKHGFIIFHVVIITLLLSAKLSAMQVYHCTTSKGELKFQDSPCEEITLKVETVITPIAPKSAPSKLIQASGNNTNKSNNLDGKVIEPNTENINNFYSMPIHPTGFHKELSDVPSLGVASLRYYAPVSLDKMINYYEAEIPVKYEKLNLGKAMVFTYEEEGINKLVSIVTSDKQTNVTLEVER